MLLQQLLALVLDHLFDVEGKLEPGFDWGESLGNLVYYSFTDFLLSESSFSLPLLLCFSRMWRFKEMSDA